MDTMNDAATTQEKEINLEHRIAQLRQLRAVMKDMKEKYEEMMSPYEIAKKKLEGALMKWLLDRKIKTTNTAAGNITWVDNTTYPIEDKVAFRKFVIDNKEWDMLDWKANQKVVDDYIEAHKDPKNPKVVNIPPGLRPNPHPHLRVSGPGKKRTSTKATGFDEDTPEEE
jgi:hypothetical protein